MKSRKVKAYNNQKKFKADIPLEENDSDVNPDSFFHDEIDDFNKKKDDELSTDDELIQHREDSSDEEEVLPITDDEKDESEEDDLDEEDERGLPNREAWGKKKSAYYSADFVDEDRGRTYREEDAEAAKAEAEEAFAIQKSVFSNINADNIRENLLLESSGESSEDEEKVDLIQKKKTATKEEKMKHLRTETRILEVSEEFKSAIQELKKLTKLVDFTQGKNIISEEFKKYIDAKKGILSLYILNLSQYMMFASSGKNIKYHPVNQQLDYYKQLLEDLKPADSVAAPLIDKILEQGISSDGIEFYTELEKDIADKKEIQNANKDSGEITIKDKNIKKSKVRHIETENEREVISLINEVKSEMKKRKLEEIEEDDNQPGNEDEPEVNQDENSDEKRIISYEIAKNKGLMPHRKKEYRNPRVRHRMKFRKAQIRRKGQVRGVYKEINRYEGEPTGINANVIKSRKFK